MRSSSLAYIQKGYLLGVETSCPVPLYQAKAELFRTLGHPVRIRVLELLQDGPKVVKAPSALAVAALGALESILSATVADGMTVGQRHDPDRELFGQGIANLVAPLFGGVPATGAIARTAVNARAGAIS